MLHNKLKVMEHRAPCKTYPQPVGWIKRYKNLNLVVLHIKFRKKKYILA